MELPLGFEMQLETPSSNYKLVPWISWDEWNIVRESLFSSSPSSVAAVLRRISAWQSRGSLPILVEVTAAFIEVQQMDPYFRNDLINDPLKSEEMLAMLYSMAIMRLVNGAVEKTREAEKLSIAEAASKIDLPRTLIDIRHDGSHHDLPSLHLLRPASVKALDWLKSYYWEPQKKAAPCQSDEIANVRKQFVAELRMVAKLLYAKKHGKKLGSELEDLHRQIDAKAKILVRLYTLFPLEIARVLLEYLLKAVESSNDNEVELSDKSAKKLAPRNTKSFSSSTNVWQHIIGKIAMWEPEVFLNIFKLILEMVEAQNFIKSNDGAADVLSLQCKLQIHQSAGISSLLVWLINSYQRFKGLQRFGPKVRIQASAAETHALKAELKNILRKFLLANSPVNNQAPVSLTLAEMIGNSHTIQKVKKLSQLGLPNTEYTKDVSTHASIDQIILQEEELLSQAAKKLEILKQWQMKGKNLGLARNDGMRKERPWTVAKSWSPCPIGMLPSEFGSLGVLPYLCETISPPEEQQQCVDSDNEHCKTSRSSGKRKASFESNMFENSSVRKKRKADWVENWKGEDGYDPRAGIWRQVGKDELLGLISAVRILV